MPKLAGLARGRCGKSCMPAVVAYSERWARMLIGAAPVSVAFKPLSALVAARRANPEKEVETHMCPHTILLYLLSLILHSLCYSHAGRFAG